MTHPFPFPRPASQEGAFFLEEDFYGGTRFQGLHTEFDGVPGLRQGDTLPPRRDVHLAELFRVQGGARVVRRMLEQTLFTVRLGVPWPAPTPSPAGCAPEAGRGRD